VDVLHDGPYRQLKLAQYILRRKLVEADLGVAFIPRMVAEIDRSSAVRVLELREPRIVWHMSLAWRRGVSLAGRGGVGRSRRRDNHRLAGCRQFSTFDQAKPDRARRAKAATRFNVLR